MADTVGVLIAGEDEETCQLLRFILQREADIGIVGHARDGQNMEALIRDLAPQVVLLDLDAPGKDTTEGVSRAGQWGSRPRFVAIASRAEQVEAGFGEFSAVVPKYAPLDNLASVLREVSARDRTPEQATARPMAGQLRQDGDTIGEAGDPMLTLFVDSVQRRNEELEESLNLVHFWLEQRELNALVATPPVDDSADAAPARHAGTSVLVEERARPGYTLSVDGFFNAQHKVTISGTEGQLHPHSWRVTARLRQESLGKDQVFLGFADAKRILREVLAGLDGKILNDLPQFRGTQPTTENISATLFNHLKVAVEGTSVALQSVTVWESPTNSVTYGEN